MNKKIKISRNDIFKNVDPRTSYTMSRIRSQDTSIEKKLRSLLWKKGYRFRKNVKSIIGKPDIVFRKKRLLIFCDSRFWHGKDFNKKVKKIKSNNEYWVSKIRRNIERDKEVNQKLKEEKWTVLRFWDTEIEKEPTKVLKTIQEYLNQY